MGVESWGLGVGFGFGFGFGFGNGGKPQPTPNPKPQTLNPKLPVPTYSAFSNSTFANVELANVELTLLSYSAIGGVKPSQTLLSGLVWSSPIGLVLLRLLKLSIGGAKHSQTLHWDLASGLV